MSISCKQISKTYGSVKALQQVDIHCESGEICGIVGANGAGKTTLFKILLGLITADSGEINIDSFGKKKAGGIIEKPAFYEYLNAHDNIKVFAKMQDAPYDKKSIIQNLEQVGLPIDRTDPVRNFSMGMKQRLGIAIALLNNPSCLILDEPFSGLDPMGIESFKNLIDKLAREKQLAVLISSHIVDVLSKLCTKLYVVSHGKIVKSGNPATLISQNTNAYTICGPKITSSAVIKNYQVVSVGDCVTISIATEDISPLLQLLAAENTLITSCTPIVDLKQLFESVGS